MYYFGSPKIISKDLSLPVAVLVMTHVVELVVPMVKLVVEIVGKPVVEPVVEYVVEPVDPIVEPSAQSQTKPIAVHDNICVVNGSSLVNNLDIYTNGVPMKFDSLAGIYVFFRICHSYQFAGSNTSGM